jgi:hypothetical protein
MMVEHSTVIFWVFVELLTVQLASVFYSGKKAGIFSRLGF